MIGRQKPKNKKNLLKLNKFHTKKHYKGIDRNKVLVLRSFQIRVCISSYQVNTFI